MEKLTEYFKHKIVRSVLDVGTGTGDFIAVLKDAFPEAKITGVDPNSESIKEAGKNYPGVTFNEMVGEKLLFPDNTFDLVSISMALHHLPDVKKTLTEMKRIVKPDGWIVVNELFSDNLNPAQEVHKLYHHFRSATHRLQGVSHNQTFKKQEILDLISQSGIEVLLQFEFRKENNLIKTPEDLNTRVEKMQSMLDEIEGYPEYNSLKPKIEEFSTKAKQFGFESATRVVVVGVVK